MEVVNGRPFEIVSNWLSLERSIVPIKLTN